MKNELSSIGTEILLLQCFGSMFESWVACLLLTAPRGGSTAAPDKFWALVAADSGVWKIIPSLEFGCQRSLAFGFCQFLAVHGISGRSWQINGGSLAFILSAGGGRDLQSFDSKISVEIMKKHEK